MTTHSTSTREASADSTPAPVLETLVVTRGGESTTPWTAEILRGFDTLRRSLSRRVHGNDGLFPGYNTLRLPDDAPDAVMLTAMVCRHDARSHDVIYEAHPLHPASFTAGPVAYATGVTLSHS